MDPSKVKLSSFQKFKALCSAINYVLPWELVVATLVGILTAISTGFAFPIMIESSIFLNYLIIGLLSIFAGVLAAGITILLLMFIEEFLTPFYRKIKESYEDEALRMKKEILDNCIDDEILK